MFRPERTERIIRATFAAAVAIALAAGFANLAHAEDASICPVKPAHKAKHHKPHLVPRLVDIPAPMASQLPAAIVPLCFKPDEPLEPVGGGVYRYYTVSLTPPVDDIGPPQSFTPGYAIPISGGYAVDTRAPEPAQTLTESPGLQARVPYAPATRAPELGGADLGGALSLLFGLSAVIRARKQK